MRADRLLSLLLLLQTRGRMPARELAVELEVSERTIYRDVVALSSAGIPVYSERGPGGGITLLESYRTTLTGLSEGETAALFMLSIPAPLEALGVADNLRMALLKLSAALPAVLRQTESHIRQRVHLDSVPWYQGQQLTPYLSILQQAVWQDLQLELSYQASFGAQLKAVVEPLGLAAKANTWYLVFQRDGAPRVLPVQRVLKANLLVQRFSRPVDFDLVQFWRQWVKENEANHARYPVVARVVPALASVLPQTFGDNLVERVDQTDREEEHAWVTVSLIFESLEDARGRLLGLGRAVEVIEPLPLRKSLVDFAEQIVAFYTTR